jgi:trans-aconitate methyltransferase
VTDRTFDAAYYQRFYGRRNAVHTKARIAHLATGVTGLAAWWGIPIRTALDIGAGPGYWRDWFAEQRPRVRYTSTDVSSYACKRFGHQLRDIATWRPSRPFDLVVCQGVLHYLDDRAASDAIANVTAATRHLLYLEAPTSEDRETVLDLEKSDLEAHWRAASWYRRRLSAFDQIGAGLWVRKGSLNLYSLERR